MNIIYYEDIRLNNKFSIGEYYVDKEEMVDFAKKWDAKPFHIDEKLAQTYPSNGLIAPLTYTLSIISRLGSLSERYRVAALAIVEMERAQVLNPVRPGDKLTVTEEHLEKRESRTRPDRGILRTLNEVKNQRGDLCLSIISVILVAKRPA